MDRSSVSIYSVSVDGAAILRHPSYSAVFGSMDIDLTSGPLPAGTYEIKLTAFCGSYNIYLPRYAKLSVDGNFIFASKEIYHGLDWWSKFVSKVQKRLTLSNQIPMHATSEVAPEGEVQINVKANVILGSLEVYRL